VRQDKLSMVEFVALLASITSLVAMSIDVMLPALSDIAASLGATDPNDRQLVLSSLFLGLSSAQMFYGPLSDSLGRKPTMYAGYVLFIVGTGLCITAESLNWMLIGRFLQGSGAAGPRTIAVAMVRDQFDGRAMARVMSLVTTVFILVPVLAPSLGQGVLLVSAWRGIFWLLLGQALITWLWLALRQPETLPPERRAPLSLARIARAIQATCKNRVALGYTVVSGLVSGAFLGYLSSSQQIFQELYGLGVQFPIYFGGLALTIGVASLVNARLVMRLGMRALCVSALRALTLLALAYLAFVAIRGGSPPLWTLMAFLLVMFFCIGILFGNVNALAMEPLGHIAGVASSVVNTLSSFISAGCGTAIGQAFDGTVVPLIAGFAVLGSASLVVVTWAERPVKGQERGAGAALS
jgi:MFS transporter, DHA1 family, multidrug resistance protein